MLKVINKNTGVFIVHFEHILHLFHMFLLLTLNKKTLARYRHWGVFIVNSEEILEGHFPVWVT